MVIFMSDGILYLREIIEDQSKVETWIQTTLGQFDYNDSNRVSVAEGILFLLKEGSESVRKLIAGYVPRVIKYEDDNYPGLVAQHSNEDDYDTWIHLAYDLVNRDADIHPDGSVPWEREDIVKPKIDREVFFDPRYDFYYYIDENGQEVECDNAGNKIVD